MTNPDGRDRHPTDKSAPEISENLYTALATSIIEASRDPVRLRQLVYSTARDNLKLAATSSAVRPNPAVQAENMAALEQALSSAIDRVEATLSGPTHPRLTSPTGAPPAARQHVPPPPNIEARLEQALNSAIDRAMTSGGAPTQDTAVTEAPIVEAEVIRPSRDLNADGTRKWFRSSGPIQLDYRADAEDFDVRPVARDPDSRPRDLDLEPSSPDDFWESEPPSPKTRSSRRASSGPHHLEESLSARADRVIGGSALAVVPEQMPVVESQEERFQDWIDHRIQVSLRSMDIPRSSPIKVGLVSIVQVLTGAAIAIGALLLLVGRPQFSWIPATTPSSAPAPHVSSSPPAAAGPSSNVIAQRSPDTTSPQSLNAIAVQVAPPTPPEPKLPFPIPRTFGVYGVNDGQLVELEQLPIKVPISRVRLSAEITNPSKSTINGANPTFVVYRRDLASSAPQTVSVRVVARVMRAMKFVDGKPKIERVEGTWRIRDKAYDLRVLPLESNREMIVIQGDPSLTLPPGRYALTIAGFGYDFTVAGPVTSLDQCLEQVDVVDGAIVSECPKT